VCGRAYTYVNAKGGWLGLAVAASRALADADCVGSEPPSETKGGTISLGEEDEPISVPHDVRLKADLDDDKLEVELKWEEA
jgi:hypothetical protein